MAELLKIEVTKKELEEGILPQNHIMMLMDYTSEGQKTKSGLVYGVNTDLIYQDSDNPDDDTSHAADMAEVSGVVVKVPQKLYFAPNDPKGMNWDTDMELQIGDRVWTNPIDSLNAVCLVCENKVYKLINYGDIYVAKRKQSEVIVINGYALCRLKNKESLSELDVISEDEIYKDKGIVAYYGKPNKAYISGDYADFEDLREGDEVLFDPRYKPFLLERQKYASRFDENELYFVIPRRRIIARLNR